MIANDTPIKPASSFDGREIQDLSGWDKSQEPDCLGIHQEPAPFAVRWAVYLQLRELAASVIAEGFTPFGHRAGELA